MPKTLGGESAFVIPNNSEPGLYEAQCGLTKREYFAGLALAALGSPIGSETAPETLAKHCVECADALLAELAKPVTAEPMTYTEVYNETALRG